MDRFKLKVLVEDIILVNPKAYVVVEHHDTVESAQESSYIINSGGHHRVISPSGDYFAVYEEAKDPVGSITYVSSFKKQTPVEYRGKWQVAVSLR